MAAVADPKQPTLGAAEMGMALGDGLDGTEMTMVIARNHTNLPQARPIEDFFGAPDQLVYTDQRKHTLGRKVLIM